MFRLPDDLIKLIHNDRPKSAASATDDAMRGLEEQLGVRLLHRTTRSVAPTEAGQQLLQRLAPMLRELDDMLIAVGSDAEGPVGRVRIKPLRRVHAGGTLLRRCALSLRNCALRSALRGTDQRPMLCARFR
jgi:Bacterial regulatory helix-turn-helix protein, lysR family